MVGMTLASHASGEAVAVSEDGGGFAAGGGRLGLQLGESYGSERGRPSILEGRFRAVGAAAPFVNNLAGIFVGLRFFDCLDGQARSIEKETAACWSMRPFQ